MPIYEYQCQACFYETEVLQKISDPPITVCPECHASSMIKKVSRTSFRLKGSGWYETDFKDPPKSKPAKADTPTESKANAANDTAKTKTETSSSQNESTSSKTE